MQIYIATTTSRVHSQAHSQINNGELVGRSTGACACTCTMYVHHFNLSAEHAYLCDCQLLYLVFVSAWKPEDTAC